MRTANKGPLNNKPDSTWKTGITKEKRDGNPNSDTVDLSNLHLGDMMTDKAKVNALRFDNIMKKWRQNRNRRKGFVACNQQ